MPGVCLINFSVFCYLFVVAGFIQQVSRTKVIRALGQRPAIGQLSDSHNSKMLALCEIWSKRHVAAGVLLAVFLLVSLSGHKRQNGCKLCAHTHTP